MLCVDDVEKQIYINSEVKGIRISDRFKDFDRLRSGYVTVSQFSRILNGLLNIKLADEQIGLLAQKYCDGRENQINYQRFCESIGNIVLNNKYFASSRTENELNLDSERAITAIIVRLSIFYEKNGFNVYQNFKNFDVLNVGRITESQFYRAFKKPEGFKEEEIALIVSKYRNKVDYNLVNYMNFCHDVTTITRQIYNRENKKTEKMSPTPTPVETPALSSIVDKIKTRMFTSRMRSKEFFGDYDKLRRGVISKDQFKSGLYRICGKELGLTEDDLEGVSFLYKTDENKINYRDFCDAMENVFINPNLETSPMSTTYRPSSQLAGRPRGLLSEDEELALNGVLDRIATLIIKRRLPLNVYLKDFDMGMMQSCLMTRSRFYRSLNNFGIILTEAEMKLIYKKYADRVSGWIHYRNFVIDVDKSYNQQEEVQQTEVGGPIPWREKSSDLDSLIGRIQQVVYNRQIRIKEFFREFDELRHGVVTRDQFRRLLSQLGFSAIGTMEVTNQEFDYLCKLYAHVDPRWICWTAFADDVNEIFGPDRERTPRPAVYATCPSYGNMDEYQQHLVNQALESVKTKAKRRGLNVRPTFQDFDKLNSGYITRNQFGQCLSLLEIDLTQSERDSLLILFCDDRGFNYDLFLSEIEPIIRLDYMYPGLVSATKAINAKKGSESSVVTNLRDTMTYIRQFIKNRDIRLTEFMEKFDKLNHGVVTKSEFHRALDSLNIRLDASQLITVLKNYQTLSDEINYREFCREAEYGLQIDFLEKCPEAIPPNLFRTQLETTLNVDEREAADKALSDVGTWVRQRRVDIFPLFKDFDVNNIGTVTKSQFFRCCVTLDLISLITPHNRDLVCKMFAKKIGGRDEVDYTAFCDRVNSLAGFTC